jgi:hypothetical protein
MYDSHICVDHVISPEPRKGSAEFLILSLIEHQPRHGYELSKLNSWKEFVPAATRSIAGARHA